MAKPDLINAQDQEEHDQDALTLQDKNLIETYSKGSLKTKKSSKLGSTSQIKSIHQSVVSNHQLANYSNNDDDLDTSDEEVLEYFLFIISI